MKSSIRYTLVFPFVLMTVAGAYAQTPASGTFVAAQNCPATRSTHAEVNASDVQIEPGHSYKLVGKNKPEAAFYLIEVPGAEPLRRWVATNCGSIDGQSSADGQTTDVPPGSKDGPSNLLVVSWQPAFCETHENKTECKTETPDRFDATHFTLHGLWPQPDGTFYCNVNESDKEKDKPDQWGELPAVDLSDATRKALEEVMPGTASNLERHEWIKHGTCFSGKPSPDVYFLKAIKLLAQMNDSEVRKLFDAHIGQKLTRDEIKDAFDRSFGAGAGDRVTISCDHESPREITEMMIGLVGPVDEDPSLAKLIAGAPVVKTSCPSGVVDKVQ